MFNKHLNLCMLFGSSRKGQAGRRWNSRKGMDYFQQILGRSVDVQCSPSENSGGGQKHVFKNWNGRKRFLWSISQEVSLLLMGVIDKQAALDTLP